MKASTASGLTILNEWITKQNKLNPENNVILFLNRKKKPNFENQFVGNFEVVSIVIMHKVTTDRKTFSKILEAIDGPVDYAATIAWV